MGVNVYDFDNTIYDGETLVDFVLYFVRRDVKIWKYMPKLVIIALKDMFHLFTVEDAVEAYASFWKATMLTPVIFRAPWWISGIRMKRR